MTPSTNYTLETSIIEPLVIFDWLKKKKYRGILNVYSN